MTNANPRQFLDRLAGDLQRKDITDLMVCKAYKQREETFEYPYEILARWTGANPKVCYAATERACERGLVEYGVSLRTGWLTEKGKALLDEHDSQGAE